MNNVTQDIKKEIFDYVSTQQLSKEELSLIDTYVKQLLEYLGPMLEIQEKVLNNEEKFSDFKSSVLKEIFGDKSGERNT